MILLQYADGKTSRHIVNHLCEDPTEVAQSYFEKALRTAGVTEATHGFWHHDRIVPGTTTIGEMLTRNGHDSRLHLCLVALPPRGLYECAVCFERFDAHWAAVPCGHMGVCERCFRTIAPGPCPVCRAPVASLQRVYPPAPAADA